MKNLPLVSVVTVSFNSAKTIRRTIESVLGQTYQRIEYILIDGGSTDGTISVISAYADKVNFFISEPDQGIYDAMNKGVCAATGDWIHILNSDDYYASPEVIELAVRVLNPMRVNYFYMWRESLQMQRTLQTWSYSRWRLFVSAFLPHPALIISKEQYMTVGLYDIRFRIAADHDLILRLTKRWPGLQHEYPLTVMQQGGASEQNILNSLREFEAISVQYGLHRYFARVLFLLKKMWWSMTW